MNRTRIILLFAAFGAIMVMVAAAAVLRAVQSNKEAAGVAQDQTSSAPARTSSFPLSGFLQQSSSMPVTSNTPVVNGKPVTSISDVAQIISAAAASSSSMEPPASELLSLPNVPDGAIAIDSSGAASALDFLGYFNTHATDISFDKNKFNAVLKDKNGIILFTPDLIDKALVDHDFPQIASSLAAQKEFVQAEINFLKSIKVTGSAIALDKEAIATQELLVDLIDKGLQVASGTLAENDFASFYDRFMATVGSAHRELVAQAVMSPIAANDSWLAHTLQFFGVSARAISPNLPFGGMIGVPIPCPCSLGVWVIVGPPNPASLFVPFAFMATPLFYDYKSLVPGAWWLGLYNPVVQIPCLSAAFCIPVGIGAEVVMVGTSGL